MDWIKVLLGILYVSIAIILLMLLYRALLRRLNKGNIDPKLFCELISVEQRPAFGIIDFCFRCNDVKWVDFEIVTLNFEPVMNVASKEFSEGQHILKFDSAQLEDGEYFYLLRTNNQQIFKKILIDNSKLKN